MAATCRPRYTTDANGRGPAWSNSLFEDNAEFGLGMRLATDKLADAARVQLRRWPGIGGSGAGLAQCRPAAKPASTSNASGGRTAGSLRHWRRRPPTSWLPSPNT
jgi:pyruvate/2-oxoacid:ferredoxin oxidoreductase beta subunit